jgi:hypothetical protein
MGSDQIWAVHVFVPPGMRAVQNSPSHASDNSSCTLPAHQQGSWNVRLADSATPEIYHIIIIIIIITASANPKPEGHRAYTQSVCSHICGA